jgi:hypothetical protein
MLTSAGCVACVRIRCARSAPPVIVSSLCHKVIDIARECSLFREELDAHTRGARPVVRGARCGRQVSAVSRAGSPCPPHRRAGASASGGATTRGPLALSLRYPPLYRPPVTWPPGHLVVAQPESPARSRRRNLDRRTAPASQSKSVPDLPPCAVARCAVVAIGPGLSISAAGPAQFRPYSELGRLPRDRFESGDATACGDGGGDRRAPRRHARRRPAGRRAQWRRIDTVLGR